MNYTNKVAYFAILLCMTSDFRHITPLWLCIFGIPTSRDKLFELLYRERVPVLLIINLLETLADRIQTDIITGKSGFFIVPILPVDLVALGRELRQGRVDQLVRIPEIVLQFFF